MSNTLLLNSWACPNKLQFSASLNVQRALTGEETGALKGDFRVSVAHLVVGEKSSGSLCRGTVAAGLSVGIHPGRRSPWQTKAVKCCQPAHTLASASIGGVGTQTQRGGSRHVSGSSG